ncbi:MAG TPA: toprim domain-containing protein [Terriglobales bacterium]|nr:toprim domain-containing protein [Terriglobales bacterium]
MAKGAKTYDNESISALKGADRVRLRPAVIFGSDGLEGCQHSFFEILANAIDEAREGHGRKIIVTRYIDGTLEVEDFGRGVPVDWNEKEGRFNWELVYCELYAGGKYNNDEGEIYEYSLGLNGLGACATQYSSEFMDVVVYRDGKRYSLHFERGENVGGLSSEPWAGKRTGTLVRWRPDREVFTDIAIPREYFLDTIRRQAVVNSGVLFVLRHETARGKFEEQEYLYKDGITDYLDEVAGDAAVTGVVHVTGERRGRDREDKPEYKVKLEVAFTFSPTVQLLEYYHNSSFLEHGGSPDKAVKSAFVSAIDAHLKAAGKYNKGESKITFGDVADCLILISSSFSTQTSYENQTKKAINNAFITEAMTAFLKEQLEVYFLENPADLAKIMDQVLINKRSREQAERARIDIKKTLSGGTDMTNRVQKFIDCRTKDLSRRELYIVEGDSALGSCKLGRDAEFQAIIPVRGKILNCLKSDYTRIFKNDIITDLLKVLGCGVEVKGAAAKKLDTFDLAALRWNKVIICTDADVDGFQIRTLILTMLYRLTPTLLREGKVYIAESPLYEIAVGDKSVFAYSDRERDEAVKKLAGKRYKIQRSKGLGENKPEMMWETTMCPASRRLVRVTPEDGERTAEVFELLLGDNLQGRKDFIAEFGHLYLDAADIS